MKEQHSAYVTPPEADEQELQPVERPTSPAEPAALKAYMNGFAHAEQPQQKPEESIVHQPLCTKDEPAENRQDAQLSEFADAQISGQRHHQTEVTQTNRQVPPIPRLRINPVVQDDSVISADQELKSAAPSPIVHTKPAAPSPAADSECRMGISSQG